MKTGFLQEGMKVVYHGHLNDTPMTFYRRDTNPAFNRWYFKYEDGTITYLTSHEVNKRITHPSTPSTESTKSTRHGGTS
jgi:hypothetical protein